MWRYNNIYFIFRRGAVPVFFFVRIFHNECSIMSKFTNLFFIAEYIYKMNLKNMEFVFD